MATASGLEYIEILGIGWPLVQAEQPGNSNAYSSLVWVDGGPMPTQAELDAWMPPTATTYITSVGNNGVTGVSMANERIIFGVVPMTTSTSIIPADKTTPLVTEGMQIVNVTVVPSDTASRMVIDMSLMVGSASSKTITASLFRNNVCIAVASNYISTSAWPFQISMHFVDMPKTRNAVTYQIRVGVNVSATWYIGNAGTGGSAVTYNNTPTSSWSITEY